MGSTHVRVEISQTVVDKEALAPPESTDNGQQHDLPIRHLGMKQKLLEGALVELQTGAHELQNVLRLAKHSHSSIKCQLTTDGAHQPSEAFYSAITLTIYCVNEKDKEKKNHQLWLSLCGTKIFTIELKVKT